MVCLFVVSQKPFHRKWVLLVGTRVLVVRLPRGSRSVVGQTDGRLLENGTLLDTLRTRVARNALVTGPTFHNLLFDQDLAATSGTAFGRDAVLDVSAIRANPAAVARASRKTGTEFFDLHFPGHARDFANVAHNLTHLPAFNATAAVAAAVRITQHHLFACRHLNDQYDDGQDQGIAEGLHESPPDFACKGKRDSRLWWKDDILVSMDDMAKRFQATA
jgi:hypothetical protein